MSLLPIASFKPLNTLQFTDHKDYYISRNVEILFRENGFSIHTLYKNLFLILQSGFNGNMKQFATYIGVPKTTAWGWLNKSTIPPLNKVLDIAYIFDIPMQTLYKECEK